MVCGSLSRNEQQDAAQRFQAAAALAAYDPDDERWKEVAPLVAEHLTVSVPSVYVDNWLQLFQPASEQLTDPLAAIHADRSRSERQREEAAIGLADYLRDQPAQTGRCHSGCRTNLLNSQPLIDAAQAALRVRQATVSRRDAVADAR